MPIVEFTLELVPNYFPTTDEATNRARYRFLREKAGEEPDPNRRAVIVGQLLKFKHLPYIHDNHVFRQEEGMIQNVIEEDTNDKFEEEFAFT